MRPPLLTIRMLLLVPASIFLAAPAMSFQNEDRVTYANSPQDLYEAKLGILKSKIEAQKGECRSTGGGQGKSYCLRSLDNELREGERELKRQLEEALAAEPD
jgi:hypothetical protein